MKQFIDDAVVQKNRWWILTTVGIVTAMSSFTLNAISIAGPNIVADYGVTLGDVAWVSAAFILTSTTLVVFFGRLGDSYGKMRQFIIGTFILTIGLFIGGIKSSFEFLLLSRVIQAVGSALTMSINFAIVTEVFVQKERGKALGVIGAFLSGGGIIGPIFSGYILDLWGYHIIFWAGVPMGIISIILAYMFMPKDRFMTKEKVDTIGFILMAGAIVPFFLAISDAGVYGLLGQTVLIKFAIAVVFFILFVLQEKRVDNPLVRLSLLSHGSMGIYLLSLFLIYTTSAFNSFIMPFYLLQALQLDATTTAFLTVLISIAITIVSPYGGRLSDRFGPHTMVMVGAGTIAVAQGLYQFFGLSTPVYLIIIVFALTGVGSGLFQTPNNQLIMSSVPKEQLGLGSGMAILTRNLALTSGSLVASNILYAAMSSKAGTTVTGFLPESPDIFMYGLYVVYWVAVGMCALSFFLVFIDKKRVQQ